MKANPKSMRTIAMPILSFDQDQVTLSKTSTGDDRITFNGSTVFEGHLKPNLSNKIQVGDVCIDVVPNKVSTVIGIESYSISLSRGGGEPQTKVIGTPDQRNKPKSEKTNEAWPGPLAIWLIVAAVSSTILKRLCLDWTPPQEFTFFSRFLLNFGANLVFGLPVILLYVILRNFRPKIK